MYRHYVGRNLQYHRADRSKLCYRHVTWGIPASIYPNCAILWRAVLPAPKIRIASIESAPFQENTYVAHLEGRDDCLVVDPGLEPEKIIDYLTENRLTPAALMITHGHADHIGGIDYLKEKWPDCPIVIGRSEAPKLTSADLNLSAGYGMPVTTLPADILVDEGQVYSAAGFDLEVRNIPGHSTGHVVFVWKKGDPIIVFVGDVIMAGSVGRCDFPGGSFPQLASGIHQKLFDLPDSTVLLSGHGPPTTVGIEKEQNPYVGKRARREDG
jgi:hydroxyacylglutathione hydrolase